MDADCGEVAWNPQVAGCTGGARHGTHPQSARGSTHSSPAWQGYLRGPAHPAATAAHVIADYCSLSPRGSGNGKHAQPRTPEGAEHGALRTRGGQRAPPGGAADAVGEGRAAARDHVRTTWRPAARGPWQGRPVDHPTARVGGGSRSPRLLPRAR